MHECVDSVQSGATVSNYHSGCMLQSDNGSLSDLSDGIAMSSVIRLLSHLGTCSDPEGVIKG